MMVGIVDIARKLLCGATIISNQHVITAVHCIKNQIVRNLGIIVGQHDVTRGNC